MNTPPLPLRLCLAAAGLCLAGCLGSLKPAGIQTRYYVLTPIPASASATAAPAVSPPIPIGVGVVRVPAYLLNKTFAYRKSANEIVQIENALWAERLDQGLQRVLAANLSVLLPTDRVQLSTWRPQEVGVEVYVSVEQFGVDDAGHGELKAQWRLLAPGGGRTLKSGQFNGARNGPSPTGDVQGAVATLGTLAADLSQELAQSINALPR